MAGTIGQADSEDEQRAAMQLNSLAAPANKPFGRQTSPLFNCPRFGRRRCRNPISEGSLDDGPDIAKYPVVGTVQSVTDKSRFEVTLGGGLMTHAVASALIGWSDSKFLGIKRATLGDNFLLRYPAINLFMTALEYVDNAGKPNCEENAAALLFFAALTSSCVLHTEMNRK
jgi:hypothetical protein